MEHYPVVDASMPQPMGHYSQVVRAGELLFIAGTPGIDLSPGVDASTARAVPGDFETEARKAFENLAAILQAAGSGLEHVVKITTFLTSPDDGPTANRLVAEHFPVDPPARSSPIVRLPRDLRFSIEAIAVVP
ncbi:MAG TPA: RidA family protein [Propionicimonas sp.]